MIITATAYQFIRHDITSFFVECKIAVDNLKRILIDIKSKQEN